ncbi:YozE family protein [Lysinibacillus sp.]|uniref:YozE family protein n=1 Tax=Lysinibacillus sp. TaxID=1869345 RepID=UPI0028B0A00F|nr:YozE family protein [Lysinibacillus sp.]
MLFKQWILQFTNEDSPRGDLAVDVRDDILFPSTKYFGEMYDYLESKRASELYLDSFKEAWKQYKEENK